MPESFPQYSINQQLEQNRLNSKLKERLGYSGIYSQRNSRQFFDRLSLVEQQELLKELRADYYQIITNYFAKETQINEQIDRFVEKAFFINLPLDKVVEIHMKLIDDLARELRFQGLHPEFLSEYRLTLIDVIAHLGEMYRSVLTENCLVSDF